MAVSQPLFEGQTTHPLSDAEREAFFKKMNISGRWFTNDNEIIRSALEAGIQTPTGAMQARAIIASSQDDFDINVNRVFNRINFSEHTHGANVAGTNDVFLNTTVLTPQHQKMLANIIFHECLHVQQGVGEVTANPVLVDAETHAMSFQMAFESNDTSTLALGLRDVSYEKSYATNYAKWLGYTQNPDQTPEGALRFKPLPGVNENDAAHEYAMQMASKETQAQFIQDFIRTPDNWHDHALPYTSYGALEQHTMYNFHTTEIKKHHGKVSVPQPLVNAMIQRYHPFLTPENFSDIRKEKVATHVSGENDMDAVQVSENAARKLANYSRYKTSKRQGAQLLAEARQSDPTVQASDIPDTLIAGVKAITNPADHETLEKFGIFEAFQNGTPLSADQAHLLRFYACKNANSSLEARIAFMSDVVRRHQEVNPERNPVRDQMITDLRTFVGTELQFVQQNTGDVRGTLRDASHEPATPPVDRTTGREGIA